MNREKTTDKLYALHLLPRARRVIRPSEVNHVVCVTVRGIVYPVFVVTDDRIRSQRTDVPGDALTLSYAALSSAALVRYCTRRAAASSVRIFSSLFARTTIYTPGQINWFTS